MKKLIYISLCFILINCANKGFDYENEELINDTIQEVDTTLKLVQHMDSIRMLLKPQIQESKKTEVAVKNTVKREKKLKKQLKETKKELKETKKDLQETKKELAQLKKVAGKRNLLQKVLNIEVDSVEVIDYTKE